MQYPFEGVGVLGPFRVSQILPCSLWNYILKNNMVISLRMQFGHKYKSSMNHAVYQFSFRPIALFFIID